jgi:hypothetical protein
LNGPNIFLIVRDGLYVSQFLNDRKFPEDESSAWKKEVALLGWPNIKTGFSILTLRYL